MKFELDTKQLERIKLTITEDDKEKGVPNLIDEFCYGLASFYVDFVLKLNLNEEKARSLKSVCISCIDDYVDVMINHGVLDDVPF